MNRVLFVVHGLGIGGAERQILAYIKRAPRELDVRLIYFRTEEAGPDLLPAYRELGLLPRLINRLEYSLPTFVWALVREMQAQRPAIVHTVLAGSPGTWGRMAAVLAGVPHIVHSDRALNPPVPRPHQILRPWLDRMTERFLPNAAAIADWLVGMKVPSQKIRVMPNGVDVTRFNPAQVSGLRSQWGIPPTATVAGFLGRFRPEKRIDVLLDGVLALPVASRPDYLVLGGDGPLLPWVQQRIEQEPWLRERCRLVGLVQEVPAFLASIDYLLLTSDYEGMPNVVLESMAMAKPVVSTAVSDVPAMIKGVGFLAQPGRVESVAQALAEIQRLTSEERIRLGQAARAKALDTYEINRAAERFWQAHLEVLR